MSEITWQAPDEDAPHDAIELGFDEEGMVYLRTSDKPETVVRTTPAKWDAFVKGVRAGEFDHFVAGVEDGEPEGSA
jgi:hypothetical protein